jgi:hypothetical protein
MFPIISISFPVTQKIIFKSFEIFFLYLGVEFLHDVIRTYVFQPILTHFSATLI